MRLHNHILVHQDIDRLPCPDLQGWLDVKVLSGDLFAGAGNLIADIDGFTRLRGPVFFRDVRTERLKHQSKTIPADSRLF
jgi:hypothetical protein